MSAKEKRLHLLFFPMLESGHIIPMLDMAKLFSRRGVGCTFVTTPGNADVVRSATKTDSSIHIHLLSFPSSVNIPQGRDNLSSYRTKTEKLAFIHSLHHLRPSLQAAVHDLRPDAVVGDIFFLSWTTPLFSELGLPQIVFHSSNAFVLCALDSYLRHNLQQEATSAEDVVLLLPGLPHRIELPRTPVTPPQKIPLFNESWEALKSCHGVVINGFYELEPEYARHCREEVLRKRTWHVGPVSLCNRDDVDVLSVRGAATEGGPSPDSRRCQAWLDSKPAGSVLYICFGSNVAMTTAQLREISVALESTSHPFIWVVRDTSPEPGASWLSPAIKHKEGAKECVVARGWVSQVLLLNHPAVGGFMTHCGWNSVVEGVSAGVPMATWPHFGDQFYNERLLVDILKIGVSVGSKHYTVVGDESPLISAADIKAAVDQLMDEGEEKQDRRARAKELAVMARRSVEVGGSSYEDIGCLIQELENWKE